MNNARLSRLVLVWLVLMLALAVPSAAASRLAIDGCPKGDEFTLRRLYGDRHATYRFDLDLHGRGDVHVKRISLLDMYGREIGWYAPGTASLNPMDAIYTNGGLRFDVRDKVWTGAYAKDANGNLKKDANGRKIPLMARTSPVDTVWIELQRASVIYELPRFRQDVTADDEGHREVREYQTLMPTKFDCGPTAAQPEYPGATPATATETEAASAPRPPTIMDIIKDYIDSIGLAAFIKALAAIL